MALMWLPYMAIDTIENSTEDATSLKCPRCWETVQIGQTVCTRCGLDLQPFFVLPTEQPEEHTSSLSVAPPVLDTEASLPAAIANVQAEEPQRRLLPLLVPIIALAVLVVAIVLVGISGNNGRGASPSASTPTAGVPIIVPAITETATALAPPSPATSTPIVAPGTAQTATPKPPSPLSSNTPVLQANTPFVPTPTATNVPPSPRLPSSTPTSTSTSTLVPTFTPSPIPTRVLVPSSGARSIAGWTVTVASVNSSQLLVGTVPSDRWAPGKGTFWVVLVTLHNNAAQPRVPDAGLDFALRDASGAIYGELTSHGGNPEMRNVAAAQHVNSPNMPVALGGDSSVLLIYDLPAGAQPKQLVARIVVNGKSVSNYGQVSWDLTKK